MLLIVYALVWTILMNLQSLIAASKRAKRTIVYVSDLKVNRLSRVAEYIKSAWAIGI